jgi:hypothetical protein
MIHTLWFWLVVTIVMAIAWKDDHDNDEDSLT